MWLEEAEFSPLGGAVRDAQVQGLVQRPPEQYSTDSCTLYDCCAVVWPALCAVVSCPPPGIILGGIFLLLCYIYLYPYGVFPIHKFTRILKLQNTPDPLPHTTHKIVLPR